MKQPKSFKEFADPKAPLACITAEDLKPLLETLQAVGPKGAGNREATRAWAELVRADAAQLPPILAALDPGDAVPLWYVFAVASLFGFLMMIPLAGVPSLLPALVDGDDLNAANALETIGYTAGGVLGPPLAGLLIAQVGPIEALYLDAASYLVFAWAVGRCRPRPKAEGPEGSKAPGDAGSEAAWF